MARRKGGYQEGGNGKGEERKILGGRKIDNWKRDVVGKDIGKKNKNIEKETGKWIKKGKLKVIDGKRGKM